MGIDGRGAAASNHVSRFRIRCSLTPNSKYLDRLFPKRNGSDLFKERNPKSYERRGLRRESESETLKLKIHQLDKQNMESLSHNVKDPLPGHHKNGTPQ